MQAEPDAENAAGGGAARANGTPVAPVVPAKPVVPGAQAGPAEAGAEPVARSRRFPSITRDTARPEGSGRAVPGAVSTPARQWPMLSVLTATAVGLLATAFGHPRVGCLAIGVALIAASVMRRVLPSVGMLAVRSRFTDMITYGLLGVSITLLALVMAAPKPWLVIPFMESAVRFTVR
ncbi:DUF3017 domain-containing protein [Streptomyces xanthophaeus]|uniref:DUF3017 domain-containing protein n=1 Tax=Streptomyces xanthophaeus TaxID=67385 RepID=UPI0026477E7F|nr:DUF3017 domain-containing protein [Streptomyces xanthophaeus]